MKKNIILALVLVSFCLSASAQNVVTKGNTWYKIGSKGLFITQIKARGSYAEHEVIAHLVNNYWNTAELTYISEFNYNHKQVKLEWGRVGTGSNTNMAVRVVPVTADNATRIQFIDISNPSFDYQLTEIDASLVTAITPKKEVFVDEWTSKVGIGTTTPQAKLEITSGGTIGSNWNPSASFLTLSDSGSSKMIMDSNEIYGNSTLHIGSTTGDIVKFRTIPSSGGAIDQVVIKSNGDVGIGTTVPDAKLTVKGNIHTQEVKVDLNGVVAPDYVFLEDYNLKTINEVEEYIKKEGHLPNIPSATEMEENGIELKQMNLKLLEKIEELTLYTIAQEKKINELQSNNKKQQSIIHQQATNNQHIASRVAKLEALLTKQ